MSIEPEIVTPSTPIEAPWQASAWDTATPGSLKADWITAVPEDQRPMFDAYKGERDPFAILTKAEQRLRDTQRDYHKVKAEKAGLPPRPEKPDDADGWKAFYEARGMPLTAEAYEIAMDAGIPKEFVNESEIAEFKAKAHELGLSADVVKELAAWQQGLTKKGLAAHAEWQKTEEARVAKETADRVQEQKELLHQNHGLNADRDLKVLQKLGEISGLDPDRLNPDSPKWVGADVVKAMASIQAMNPKAGDPTGRMAAAHSSDPSHSVDYWKNLAADHPDYLALTNPMDTRHATVKAARDQAYARQYASK